MYDSGLRSVEFLRVFHQDVYLSYICLCVVLLCTHKAKSKAKFLSKNVVRVKYVAITCFCIRFVSVSWRRVQRYEFEVRVQLSQWGQQLVVVIVDVVVVVVVVMLMDVTPSWFVQIVFCLAIDLFSFQHECYYRNSNCLL